MEALQCEETDWIDQLPGNESSPSQLLEQQEMQEVAKKLYDAVMGGIRARSSAKKYQICDLYKVKGWTVEKLCEWFPELVVACLSPSENHEGPARHHEDSSEFLPYFWWLD